MLREVVIVSAARTAIGKMGGAMKNLQPEDMSKIVMEELIKRAGVEKGEIEEVIWAQTKQSADAANIARVAALKAGLPIETPAYTVMRQCGSAMQSVNSAMQAIMCGQADILLAGGVESMSNAIYYLRNARYGYGAGNAVLVDSNTESQPGSQPREIYGDKLTMGMTAENLASKYNITREEQDIFALGSQNKAFAAIEAGRFKDEIVPVVMPAKKGDPVVFEVDEHPFRTTMEKLAKLPPAFKKDGTVTAGNSSGRNDGAAGVILMSAEMAKKKGLKPMAVIRSIAAAGCPPEIMGIGPVPATAKALKIAGLKLDDIGLIELNEAFAAQSLACIKEAGFNQEITNVNGSGISLGHPLGCTGARIIVTLLYEMQRRKTKYGLATLCIAGGQGMATIVENVQ